MRRRSVRPDRRARATVAKAAVLVPVVLAVLGLTGAAPSQAEDDGLRTLGTLPVPPDSQRGLVGGSGTVIQLDAVGRKLYYMYFKPSEGDAAHLREYDLTPRIPRLLRDRRIFSGTEFPVTTGVSPYTVAIDRTRDQMLLLNNNSGETGRPYRIQVVDLKTLTALPAIELVTTTPGFIPYGMTYSPQDDRLYLLGDVQAYPLVYALNPNGVYPLPITAAAALDMKTRQLAWIRPLPQCQTPLSTFAVGSLVARSIHRDALYFACIRPGPYPGESGVIRLSVTPDADMAEAQTFGLEFFPVSGLYTGGSGIIGVAAFDAASERFFMQSLSPTTPGAWVFDGRLSAWVGFVAAPDDFNLYIGADHGTGRLYIGGAGEPPDRSAYIVVSDGRATPVPQGNAFSLPGQIADMIHIDPATRRIFVTQILGTNPRYNILILEDSTALAPPVEPIDYDALTNDVEESGNTAVAYAGSVAGFGSHVFLAGGYGGVLSICGGSLDGALCPSAILAPLFEQNIDLPISPDNTVAGFKPGDRGVYMARAPSVDIRNVGASASAQTLAPDPLTSDEYETRFRDPIAQTAGDAAGDEAAQQVYDQLVWPHRAVACLDGGGRSFEEERVGPGGSSSITCDLKTQTARAVSRFAGFTTQGVSVASSAFEAMAVRDPKLGTVTESLAVAKGIEIQGAAGTVSIAEVAATAKTVARGRPKTAVATWERSLSGVVVRDASGDVTFHCGDADGCDPRAAVAAMNEVLGVRVRVYLPEPEREATPKGAFASVGRKDADYYNALTVNNDNSRAAPALEILVLNDSVEKSRLVVQLAGVQASSIYGISSLPGSGAGTTPSLVPPVPVPSVGPLPPFGPPAFAPPAPPGHGGAAVRFARAALFFVRSPKDALLVGLLGLVFVGVGAAAWRRRALMTTLTGSS